MDLASAKVFNLDESAPRTVKTWAAIDSIGALMLWDKYDSITLSPEQVQKLKEILTEQL